MVRLRAAETTGLALGLVGALVARRWIGPLLSQTSLNYPAVMLVVAGLLWGAALAAAAFATLLAAQPDRATALRVD